MWFVIVIVIVAVVAMTVAGRQSRPGMVRPVERVDAVGLHLGEDVFAWDSVFEVVVMTRRELGGVWYRFEILSETGGALLIDGKRGKNDCGQAFLAETHRFAGFDHGALSTVLGQSRGRAVCYSR